MSLKDSVIMVTGGAGFIGHHLVNKILSFEPKELIIIDDLSTGLSSNISDCLKRDNVYFIEKKAEDLNENDLPSKIDYVFHLAAIVSVPYSILKPYESHLSNEHSFLNILEIAKKTQVQKVIFASSSAVYGEVEQTPIKENAPLNPQSPYAFSKLINELHARSYSQLFEMDYIGFRFFNVYGPGQRADSPYSGVISIFMDKISRNEEVVIFGDGSQVRDFVHVSDVVAGLIKSATSSSKNEVYNLGTSQPSTVNQLFNIIKELHPSYSKQVVYEKEREGDIKISLADNQKFRKEISDAPFTSLHQGLKDLLNELTSI